MNRLKFTIFFLATLVGVSSCKKSEGTITIPFHTDYSGLTAGKYIIYDATEIFHDDAVSQHDTSNFLLKTVIGEVYKDNAGREAREYLRYKSYDQGQTYSLEDVWTCIVVGNKYELIEENQRKVRLMFPPKKDKEWDLNMFNNAFTKLVYYEKVHEPSFVDNLFFDSALVVIEDDFFSLVDYRKQKEIYAKGVGLIVKSYKNLVIENFDTLAIKSGSEIYYNVIAHGFQ